MSRPPIAQSVVKEIDRSLWSDHCALTYEDRFFRRKLLTTEGGLSFVLDLAQTTSLEDGDTIELDGSYIGIRAKEEPLLEVKGPDLPRLAWHVGNRHTPCQIEADRLVILRDPVIGHMLEHVGAELREIEAPFTPEGGAYGHGRTHSHEHGHTHHD